MKPIPIVVLALAGTLASAAVWPESLYSEATFRPLVSDRRARLQGDALTVLVFENSSASTTADTNLQRNTNLTARAQFDQRNHGGTLGLGNNFDGGGTVHRSGKVLAQITVRVERVAENGDLMVSGEQWLEINSDRQHIKLEGRVRPTDISSENTVLSNRIADAKIRYVGDGELAKRQEPGWISKVLTWLGL